MGIARFIAHFDSECHGCMAEIREGDDMGYDKDTGEYICQDCIEGRS